MGVMTSCELIKGTKACKETESLQQNRPSDSLLVCVPFLFPFVSGAIPTNAFNLSATHPVPVSLCAPAPFTT